jgi:GntR family transcriptional regulator
VAQASLDRASPVPLWRQLEGILRAELAGARQTQPQAFTEQELTTRFRVSRYTVRQALDALRREGLVDRARKRGTFPSARAPIQQPLEGLYSFGRSMSGLGLGPESRVLSLRSVWPDEALRGQLDLPPTATPLVELIRLRKAAGEPLVLETIWLPAAAVPHIAQEDLSGSVYDLLRDRYGLHIDSAQERIRPIVLGGRDARLLASKKGAPAFFVERVSYVGTRPVEVRHSIIRGDRYLYSIRLHPGQATSSP